MWTWLLWVSYWMELLSNCHAWLYFTATGEDDLCDTIRELSDIAASWRNIGIFLGVRDSRLEAIQGNNPLDCLRQTLATWLRRNYNVKRFGEPTWVKLVEAVNDSAGGGNSSLAMEIARRHGGMCSYIGAGMCFTMLTRIVSYGAMCRWD